MNLNGHLPIRNKTDPLLGGYGKSNVDFLTWLKGPFDFRPLSITYYLVEQDTVIDGTLSLRGTDISALLIGLNPLTIDSAHHYFAEIVSGISFKSIVYEPLWLEGYSYGSFSTDMILGSNFSIGAGMQISRPVSVLIRYFGAYSDVSYSNYANKQFGKTHYKSKIGIDGEIAYSRWFGITMGAGYWMNGREKYPVVSLGCAVTNWFHIPFEALRAETLLSRRQGAANE